MASEKWQKVLEAKEKLGLDDRATLKQIRPYVCNNYINASMLLVANKNCEFKFYPYRSIPEGCHKNSGSESLLRFAYLPD